MSEIGFIHHNYPNQLKRVASLDRWIEETERVIQTGIILFEEETDFYDENIKLVAGRKNKLEDMMSAIRSYASVKGINLLAYLRQFHSEKAIYSLLFGKEAQSERNSNPDPDDIDL